MLEADLRDPKPRDAPVSAGLVVLCVLAFAVSLALALAASDDRADLLLTSLWSLPDQGGALRRLGALDLTRIWLDREWWRLLSAALLHGSWVHLLLNMSALWSVGSWLERALGGIRALLVFGLSALTASLASVAWCEAPLVVGASGGIFGMAGALLVIRWRGDHLADRVVAVSPHSLAVMIALCLALGAVVPVIAQAGHIGGLLGGLLVVAALTSARWTRRLAAALVLGAALLFGFSQAAAPQGRANFHHFLALRHLNDDEPERALPAFERALELRPDDATLQNAIAYHLALAGHNLDRAETLVRAALSAEPNNSDFLDTLGWIFCRRGQPEAGMPLLERAHELAAPVREEIREHLETCATAAAAPSSDVPRGTSRRLEAPEG